MDRKRNFNRHQKRPFAGRSQQPPPSAGRREAQDSYNARRNYERYMALAQAELQAGDRVAAENYYQHAEHYFRMSSDPRSDIAPKTTAVALPATSLAGLRVACEVALSWC